MHDARAVEDADHLLVEVEMIGRAAGWDPADELGHLAVDQFAIPAVTGALNLARVILSVARDLVAWVARRPPLQVPRYARDNTRPDDRHVAGEFEGLAGR